MDKTTQVENMSDRQGASQAAADRDASSGASDLAVPTLPVDAAQHYINDMLVELCDIAHQAGLKDLAALLKVTVTAVETNRRLR